MILYGVTYGDGTVSAGEREWKHIRASIAYIDHVRGDSVGSGVSAALTFSLAITSQRHTIKSPSMIGMFKYLLDPVIMLTIPFMPPISNAARALQFFT